MHLKSAILRIPASRAVRSCQSRSHQELAFGGFCIYRTGPTVKRTYVYVDGFNLYYRALKKTKYKWLNIEALVKGLLEKTWGQAKRKR